MNVRLRLAAAAAALSSAIPNLSAWDYPGHRIVNQVALASLPADFPAFVRDPAAAERIAYLSGEPDRWRSTRSEPLQHYNGMDHYLDIEQIPAAGLDLATLTPFRYQFAAAFAAGRAAHADRFPRIDPARDLDHAREWCGFLPWAIAEYYAKLQNNFSELKTFQRYGTPSEVENARENILYLMGVMGHYVGDGSQPLHTTIHHHGWVGPNPNGYTTRFGFHEWIDGGFIAKAGITPKEVISLSPPARPLDLRPRGDGRDPVFADVMAYLTATFHEVEPLYRLEKEHKLEGPGPESREGRAFIDSRLRAGGEMLGSLWLTAWKQAGIDDYLRKELLRRHAGAS